MVLFYIKSQGGIVLNSSKKYVLLSFLSVGVSIFLLGYSAFAWFSISKEVKATGMNMTITAPSNLEISSTSDTEGFSSLAYVKLNEVVYKEIEASDDEIKFNKDNDTFYLLPASSFEGLSIWKCDSAKSDGSANCNEVNFENVTAFDDGRIKYDNKTNSFDGYYIDVPLWLRTYSETDLNVHLSDINTNIINTYKPETASIVRMAFLNENADGISNGENPLVYQAPDSTSTCTKVVTDNAGISKFTEPQFMKFTDNLSQDMITKVSGTRNQNGTLSMKPVKITLRIWIEGQDSNCVSTALNGTKKFDINLGLTVKE